MDEGAVTGRAPETTVDLLERQGEMAEAHAALEAARSGSGQTLLIQGPAGIGKTELARALRGAAAAHRMEVASARGGELESEFPYGVVRQLFEPLVLRASAAERESLLEGAAGLAARVLVNDIREEPAPPPVADSGPILHGLYWLVSNLAERGPIMLTVDDVHWSDEASLGFLHYLARRIEDLSVLLVMTERLAHGRVSKPLVARIAAEPTCRIVRPTPLSVAAVGSLIRSVLGNEPEDEFIETCHESTGGNPLLLNELLGEVARIGIVPTAAASAEVRSLAPETISRSVLVRLARLPPHCEALARAIATLGDGVELRRAAVLASLEAAEAASAGDLLATVGILTPESPRGFVHPLLREAVYAAIPAGDRSVAHHRAAKILQQEGSPSEAVAAQLLPAEPAGDHWVVAALRRAAADALAHGVPRSAAHFLSRALEEDPAHPSRFEILAELGIAQARAALDAAIATLTAALQLGGDPNSRAEIAIELARILSVSQLDYKAAVEVLDGVSEEGLDPELALRVQVERLRWEFDPMRPDPIPSFEEVHPLAEGPGGTNDVLLSQLSGLALLSGQPAKVAADLALRAIKVRGDEYPGAAVVTLLGCDRFDEVAETLDSIIEEGRRLGRTHLFGVATLDRGQLSYRLGKLADAEADYRLVREIIHQLSDSHPALSYPSTGLAELLLERGDLERAEELLAAVPPRWDDFWFLETRARLRTAQGRPEDAIEDLSHFRRFSDRFKGPCYLAWRSTLAVALQRLGEEQDAIRLAQEEVELAQQQGPARTIGVALRVLGTVTPGAEGTAHLEAAVEILQDSPAELERGKALYEFGRAMRRARKPKEARTPLGRALELAHRCGATALVEAARQELAAAGAKPRRIATTGIDALTPSERRVAELAAQGSSNRQIAQSLFVSVWTVATHLTSVYQKLGIEGRRALHDFLSDAAREADSSIRG